MDLNEMAITIEKQALDIGEKNLVGKKFETFDNSLLRVEDTEVMEHVDFQASGQFYYGMLVRKALDSLKAAELRFNNWYVKVYDKCNEIIKAETGVKRPNKVDVENRVKRDYNSKYEKLITIIAKKGYVYERINLWYSAWLTKGFSLSDLSARKSRRIGRDTRSLLGRRSSEREDEE